MGLCRSVILELELIDCHGRISTWFMVASPRYLHSGSSASLKLRYGV